MNRIYTSRVFACAGVLFFAGVSTANVGARDSDRSQPDVGIAVRAVERAAERLAPMRAAVDRAQIEIDALARAQRDPKSLVDFVRDEVVFQPYPGLLKGARGTLLTRAGNALDQALLLGAALETAGAEVQLVRGRLSTDQADLLVRSATTNAVEFPAALDSARARARLRAILRGLDLPDEWTARALALLDEDDGTPGRAEDHTGALGDTDAVTALLLERVDANQSNASIHAQLIARARDYHWIRWRATPSDPWRDAHVAFPPAGPGTVDVAQTLDETVEDDLRHFVEIQVVAEAVENGKRVERPLNRHWRQSTAALIAEPVSISLLPEGLTGPADLLALGDGIDDVRRFELSINGQTVAGAGSVDLAGQVPARGKPEGLSGLSQGLGGALTGGGTARAEAGPALTAVFVDYRFESPAGSETVRRALFDRQGPAARAAGRVEPEREWSGAELARALAGERVFMIDVGPMAPALALDQAVVQILDKADAFSTMLDIAGGAETESAWTDLQLEQVNPLGHLALIERFGADAGGDNGRLNFRPEAGLVELAVHPLRREAGTIHGYVDIVRNPRRVLRLMDSGWQIDFAATLRAGVWETRMERALVPAGMGEAFDTFAAFDSPAKTRVLRPGEATQDIPGNADFRARLAAELAAGRIVVVADDGEGHSGWWRIDPATGQTLGMTSEGRGQAMVEYVETTVKRAQSLYGHVETIMGVAEQLRACREQHGGLEDFDELFCCMASVYVDTASGPAAGQAKDTGLGGSLFVTVLGAAADAAGGSEQICNDLISSL